MISAAPEKCPPEGKPSGVGCIDRHPVTITYCPSARGAVRFYRARVNYWRARVGAGTQSISDDRKLACPRYLAHRLQRKAYGLRARYEHWITKRTLQDFKVREGNHAWHRAVREVQKVYPGTESWLLSCSWAEGRWGRWVSYRGLYSPEYAAAHYIVGGWMQFKYPTFTGMYRHAMQDVRSKGYFLPRGLVPGVEAWQSPLAQALAAGWARYTGNDGHHWYASYSRGC